MAASFDEHYRTSLTGLSPAELRALFTAADAGPLGDLGLTKAVEGTLLKLFAALPTTQQQEVGRLRQRFYLDSVGWFDYRETPSLLPDLQQAVWEDRQIFVTYCNYEGATTEQTLDPYALVAKASVWYLIARNGKGIYRTYRAARIARLALTTARFARDAAFDPVRYWKETSRDFERMRAVSFPFYPAVLRLTTAAFDALRDHVPERYEQIEEADTAGWLTVRVLFLSLHEARMNVLGAGTQICVIEPAELQQSAIATAKAIIAANEDSRR